uniref:Uncharacterized protein n=1 Tax=Panagrolaimus superbus TaxID=310955 RepID=A0A914Y8V2_9BILA
MVKIVFTNRYHPYHIIVKNSAQNIVEIINNPAENHEIINPGENRENVNREIVNPGENHEIVNPGENRENVNRENVNPGENMAEVLPDTPPPVLSQQQLVPDEGENELHEELEMVKKQLMEQQIELVELQMQQQPQQKLIQNLEQEILMAQHENNNLREQLFNQPQPLIQENMEFLDLDIPVDKELFPDNQMPLLMESLFNDTLSSNLKVPCGGTFI